LREGTHEKVLLSCMYAHSVVEGEKKTEWEKRGMFESKKKKRGGEQRIG